METQCSHALRLAHDADVKGKRIPYILKVLFGLFSHSPPCTFPHTCLLCTRHTDHIKKGVARPEDRKNDYLL